MGWVQRAGDGTRGVVSRPSEKLTFHRNLSFHNGFSTIDACSLVTCAASGRTAPENLEKPNGIDRFFAKVT